MSEPVIEPEERPEWLLEKFPSTEDQAKAYAESEKEMNRMRAQMDQQANQFSEALQNMQAFQEPAAPQYDPSSDPLLNQYQQALDQGDARAMLSIQLELNRISTEEAIKTSMKEIGGRFEKVNENDREVAITLATERVARGYDNWEDLAPKIGAVIQENQQWLPQNASVEAYERTLKYAADLVTAQEIVAQKNKDDQSRQSKLDAQGLQGSGARAPMTPDEAKVEWDRIRAIDLGGYSGIIGA